MRRLLLGVVLAGIAHSAGAQGYWYYCDPAHAYYPYVSTCPVPWRAVVPSPNAFSNDAAALSADQRGAIGDHVRACWAYDPAALGVDQMQVLLTVTTDPA